MRQALATFQTRFVIIDVQLIEFKCRFIDVQHLMEHTGQVHISEQRRSQQIYLMVCPSVHSMNRRRRRRANRERPARLVGRSSRTASVFLSCLTTIAVKVTQHDRCPFRSSWKKRRTKLPSRITNICSNGTSREKQTRERERRKMEDDDLHRVCHIVGPSIRRQNEVARDISPTTHTCPSFLSALFLTLTTDLTEAKILVILLVSFRPVHEVANEPSNRVMCR